MNKCPKNCPNQLLMAERHGVEIDYCPECRGVWLDRGELDKIIDRAIELERPQAAAQPAAPVQPQMQTPVQPQAPVQPGPAIPQAPVYPQQPTPAPGYGYPRGSYDNDYDYKKRRKKSFLGELFDFD